MYNFREGKGETVTFRNFESMTKKGGGGRLCRSWKSCLLGLRTES